MWIRELFAGLLGFASGLAVAGGMFALLIALGVISRFAGKTHTAAYVIQIGLFSGVFTGTWAMALTEIVDAVPVFSRRIRLKTGMPWLILSMALGRAAGAWMHAYFGYGW